MKGTAMKKYTSIPDFFRKYIGGRPETGTEILSVEANKVISELSGDYLIQVRRDVMAMADILKKARRVKQEKRFHLVRDDFFLKVHDMKGQGTTFGYPLLSDLGKVACDYLRHKTEVSLADLDYLVLLVADIQTVLDKKLTDKGGKLGAEIKKRWVKDNK